MMDFDLGPGEQIWWDTLERYLARHVPPEYVRRCDAERRYPAEAWDQVAAEGWLGLLLPADLGGMGAGAVMFAIFSEVLAQRGVPFAEVFTVPMFTASNVARHGGPAVRPHLESFLAGRGRFAIAITEPNAGSDAAALALRATPDGSGWRLHGQKVFTSGANVPDTVIVVAARTDPAAPKHQGISLFLVPNNAPGVEVRPLATLSRRCFGTNEVFFTDTPGQLLGELNQGWAYLTGHLELERVSIAASYLGAAGAALAQAKAYARQRRQFGRYIVEFQAIRHTLAQLQTEWEAARLLTYRAACQADRGRRCLKEAAMAKLWAAEVSVRIAREAMVILGGYGQLPEYDVERHYREAIQNLVGGGTPQIQRSVIARELGL